MERRPQLIGKYEVLEEKGSGGYGVVYRAWDPDLKRFVAIKTFVRVLQGTDSHATLQGLAQDRLAAPLDHPNIIRIFDWAPEGVVPYMVMEYVPYNLQDFINRGPLPPSLPFGLQPKSAVPWPTLMPRSSSTGKKCPESYTGT